MADDLLPRRRRRLEASSPELTTPHDRAEPSTSSSSSPPSSTSGAKTTTLFGIDLGVDLDLDASPDSPRPSWATYAPIGTGVLATGLLAWGTYRGFKQATRVQPDPPANPTTTSGGGGGVIGSVSAKAKPPVSLSAAARRGGKDIPISRSTHLLAVRALAYGTLLALSGGAVLMLGVAYALDVDSLQAFSDCMSDMLGSRREAMTETFKVSAVADAMLKKQEEAGPGVDNYEADLTPAERKAIADLTSVFSDDIKRAEEEQH